ncbi:hydrogenase maturation protease [Streptomyces sp. SCSIO 30461]|uniref:hydrogenase maturation protease n=1 Tax=Streptomyces sp. SCSIO 30461 TaxID=3118085 RepID=UPI0030D1887C
MQCEMRAVVLGVGNDFRYDDGVGWAVVEKLRNRSSLDRLPPGTELRICGGDPVRLIEWWDGADLAVVIDAARVHPGHPGRVHRTELSARQPSRSTTASSHGFGLGEAWSLARLLGRLPRRLVVYAVQIADVSVGRGLSPVVAAAVDSVAESVISEIVHHAETQR